MGKGFIIMDERENDVEYIIGNRDLNDTDIMIFHEESDDRDDE